MTKFPKPTSLLRFVATLFCMVSMVSAEEILFIGNSFTHGQDPRLSQHGGVPAVFEAIAEAKGKNVEATMMAASGKDWGFHLKNQPTLDLIESKKWDVVILQDFSTKPTHIGDRKAFLNEGQELCDLVWKHSPDAKIVLYRTWARKPGNSVYSTKENKSSFKDFDEMDDELGKGYRDLFKKLTSSNRRKTILLAPVGDAFATCVKDFADTEIYGEDAYHAGVQGSYLAALIFYKTIYSDSPVGAIREFPTFSVDEATAGILQKLADTTK